MEDYERFCSGVSVQLRSPAGPQRSPLGQEVSSTISFHGRPVLLPLLNEDRGQEMRRYRQQAAQLEAERPRRAQQNSLLARVQNILNTIQLQKVTDRPETQRAPLTCSSPEPGTVSVHAHSSPLLFRPDQASGTCRSALREPGREGRTAVSPELQEEQRGNHGVTAGGAGGPMEREEGRGQRSESEGLCEGPSVLEGSYSSDGEDEDSASRKLELQGDEESHLDSVTCTPPRYRLEVSTFPSPDYLLGSLPHSLTGSYARLPSPDPSSPDPSPLRHSRTPGSSITTGNILISCPVSGEAVELHPPPGEGQAEKGLLGNWVSILESPGKRWMMDFPSLPPNSPPLPSAASGSSKGGTGTAASSFIVSDNEGLTDDSSVCTPPSRPRGPTRVSPLLLLRDEGSPPPPAPPSRLSHHVSFQLGSRTLPPPPSPPSPEKGSRSPAPRLHTSPLNRSYDVDSPEKGSRSPAPQLHSSPLNRSYDVDSPEKGSRSPAPRLHTSPAPRSLHTSPLNRSYDVDSPEKGSRSPAPRLHTSPAPRLHTSPAPRCLHSPPAPLNRSYDVESPVLTLQRPCVAPLLSPGQVPHSVLESWSSSRRTLAHLTRSTGGPDHTAAAAIQRQIQVLEEMKQRLEEEHAHQLSLLVSVQLQEQQRLRQTLQGKERGPRGGPLSTSPPAGHPGNYRESLNSTWASVLMLQQSLECLPILGPSPGPRPPLQGSTPPLPLPGPTPPLQVSRPGLGGARVRLGAVARGFLTRRLLNTEKVKLLRKTVRDTQAFITSFRKRGAPLSPQDRVLHLRVSAQLRAALFDVHELFHVLPARERMVLIQQDRELLAERRLRDMEKDRSPRDKVTLSTATQKSLERKRQRLKESLRQQGRQTSLKTQSPSPPRILQPNQDQNAPPPSSLPRPARLVSKNQRVVRSVAQKKKRL